MEKREKKVVVTLLVTALFGASQLILSSTGSDQGISDSQSDVTSFVNTIKTDLVKTSLNESEKTVMVHITNKPAVDPFVDAPAPLEFKSKVKNKAEVVVSRAEVQSSAESNKYRYTGYFLMDNEKIAIVNGKEYSVGQIIAGTDVVLQRINSFAVELKNMSSKKEFSVKFNFKKQH